MRPSADPRRMWTGWLCVLSPVDVLNVEWNAVGHHFALNSPLRHTDNRKCAATTIVVDSTMRKINEIKQFISQIIHHFFAFAKSTLEHFPKISKIWMMAFTCHFSTYLQTKMEYLSRSARNGNLWRFESQWDWKWNGFQTSDTRNRLTMAKRHLTAVECRYKLFKWNCFEICQAHH